MDENKTQESSKKSPDERVENPSSVFFNTVLCSPFGSNFLFCSTGVVQVILYQWLDYHGIEGGRTGVGVLASYLGLLICALPFLFDERDRRPRFHKMFVPTVVCDILGQTCAQLAIELCGSGLFMVIYSSITVFAALFRWYFYAKQLTWKQWTGVIIITVGLCITALGGKDGVDDSSEGSVDSAAASDHAKVANIITGMFFALLSAIFYAWVYVWTEQLMKGNFSAAKDDLAPSPMGLATFSGFVGTLATTTYIAIFVGPHWDTLIIEPARMEQSSYTSVRLVYVVLLLACGLHNTSIVYVGKSGGGAVATGVNKAIQTISVFIVSALAFGRAHHEQQFSFEKGLGVAFVIGGVLFYSYNSVKGGKNDIKGHRYSDSSSNSSAGAIKSGVELRNLGQSRTESLSNRVATKLSNALGKSSRKVKYSSLSTIEAEDATV